MDWLLLLWILAKPPALPWPDVSQGQQAGCELLETPPERNVSWWHTHVWIQFPDKRWVRLYSVRPGNERSKALKDCDEFLHEYQKRRVKK